MAAGESSQGTAQPESGLVSLLDTLADKVAQRVIAALKTSARNAAEPDQLLTQPEAALRLGVTTAWLARHASGLPFTRRLGHRTLRFSSRGIDRWLSRAGDR